MRIPKFTADASLYRTTNRYRSGGRGEKSEGTTVVPQIGGKDFKGKSGCVMDCLDKYPNLTPLQCSRRCSDSGIAGKSSDDWLNDTLTGGGIDFWEIGCSALSNAYLCGKMADVMRRQS